jgi:hypothetical protein
MSFTRKLPNMVMIHGYLYPYYLYLYCEADPQVHLPRGGYPRYAQWEQLLIKEVETP